jgi:Fibronectin type III domain
MARHAAILVAAVALLTLAPDDGPARAWWSQTVPGTSAAASLTLAAPSDPDADGACSILVIGPAVDLTWTASPSSFATGYEVLRASTSSGPFVAVATVTGSSTVSYTDTGLAALTTYHYRIRSRSAAWASPATVSVSAKTPLLCL